MTAGDPVIAPDPVAVGDPMAAADPVGARNSVAAWVFTTVGVVLASARHQMLVFLGAWRIPTVLGLVQPALLLIVMLSLPEEVTAGYASRAATGVLLVSFWSFTVWTGAGILHRDRAEGTLGPCLVGVRDFRLVLVGKSLGATAASVLLTLTTMSIVLAALRQPLRFEHPWWFAAGLVATLASGLTLGVGLSSLFVLTRFATHLSAALMYPVFLLGGLLTPLSAIPAGVRWLSWGVSLRWSMTFLTSAGSGDPDVPALLMVLALTAVYAVAAAFVLNQFSRVARMRGTIELV